MEKKQFGLLKKEIYVPEKRLFIDSHECKNYTTYITERFKEQGVVYVRKRLAVGDYMIPGDFRVIERKKSLAELAYNFSSAYKRIFKREFDTAKKLGLKIILLIENDDVSCIDDLVDFADLSYDTKHPNLLYKARNSGVDGKLLRSALNVVINDYDVSVYFCSHMQAGEKIMSILFGE